MTDKERLEKQKARAKKWEERGRKFWRAFLFTKDGRPKSGFMIYTFCLSFVVIGIYLLLFWAVIEILYPFIGSWPVVPQNLLQTLIVAFLGLMPAWAIHNFVEEKRLMLGTYLWLALYTIAAIVTELIILKGTGTYKEFFIFLAWFVLIPLLSGLIFTAYLAKRDYKPPVKKDTDVPSWKKYINT